MYELSVAQTETTSGGLPWMTPALVALSDSAVLGPLGWSFAFGWGIGTALYHMME